MIEFTHIFVNFISTISKRIYICTKMQINQYNVYNYEIYNTIRVIMYA